MSSEHPLTGVGLGNFEVRALDYVRRPGALPYVGAVIERPHAVHNAYLQALAETGAIGLALLVAFVLGALGAPLHAARRFKALGDRRLAQLSVSLLIGNIGLMTAAIFLSIGADRTVWFLLGLGPVLLGIAYGADRAASRPLATGHSGGR
jgi:O-antigen ligase